LEPKPLTGIILAGGKSTRMGKNKALIEIEGIPIIERICVLFKRLFQEVWIITDQAEVFHGLGAKLHDDLIPNLGALGGLYSGLVLASFPHSFCVACDMPFLREPLIDYLVRGIDGFAAVVPRTKDGWQPLHAVYSKSCLEVINEVVAEKKTKIIDIYPRIKLRVVEEEEFHSIDPLNESFINVNTPEDLARIEAGRRS
jgi:molybdopterin-guanine dinucleotide biosynthesis protein A